MSYNKEQIGEAIKDKVNLLNYILSDAPQSKVKRSGATTFLTPCPFCNKGTKTPHFAVYEASNSFNSFGCTKNGVQGGTIIDYVMASENLDTKEAIKKVFQLANLPFEEAKPRQSQDIPQKSEEEKEAINKFCLDSYNNMNKKDGDKIANYLQNRGISAEAMRKYHLFYFISTEQKSDKEFVIIPILEDGKAIAYIGRNLNNKDAFRYKNSRGTLDLFNKQYLKKKADAENELLFICEGVFDAISIEEQGFKAISLNSTSNTKKLIEAVKENLENAKSYKFIIATDTDPSGQKAKEELQAELTKLDISNSFLDIPYTIDLETKEKRQYKDVNEWLCNADKDTFKDDLEANIYNKYEQASVLYYMDDYYRELENYSKRPTRSTGFKLLDEQLDGGIKSGLYVIGAIPSLRKNNACITNSGQCSKTRAKSFYLYVRAKQV